MNRYISASTDKTKQSFGKRPMEFAKRPKSPLAMREMHGLQKYVVEFCLLMGLWALGVLIGPFGTFLELGFGDRVIYWGTMSVVNWAQVRAILFVLEQPPVMKYLNFWTLVLAAAALASIPATFEVMWLEGTFRSHRLSYGECYVYVFLLTLAITGPVTRVFLWRDAQADAQGASSQPQNVQPADCAFLDRLPPALGRHVLCVGSEDHYVRVYTDLGDDLILLRFSDAVAELARNPELAGMQVHRSWWVADAARVETLRQDRKIVLKLKNNLEIPVSRSYLPKVREAGWI